MRFAKMREAGNEYLCLDNTGPDSSDGAVARGLEAAARHSGRLLVIGPGDQADFRMDMFQPDGSPMESCGDGLRCAGKFIVEQGLSSKPQLTVQTHLRVWFLDLQMREGKVAEVGIDMGPPVLQAANIPTSLPGNPPLDIPMTWPDTMFNVSCVSLGDPHAVVFVPELTDDLVFGVGEQMSRHSVFPRGTNVEFVRRNGRDEVTVRVWGRTGGERTSSASAAGAVVVAGALTGRTGQQIKVHMPGGDLVASWTNGPLEHVHLKGSAEEVLRGEWPEKV